jgi:hypothetical protein
MEKRYLGQDVHELILGEKLNGFRSPKSKIERDKIIKNAQDWIANNQGKHINLY